ncbi:hypothetical protein [Nesterenkonia aerolata]|uniref:Uncharacterized protein n=1 Tax=Nesterenkonia aerolata TaxID=3074079 RepID=A0ABU2DNY4_9MICC|nr:hypothetical protein [Nesterenkonia sp. LY-0111]MDR8018196.1 hypothetical protein [Nesterenkonia sp. LY-0111]
MTQSTEATAENDVNAAINDLISAATGLSLYEQQWYLRNSTQLSSERAWGRLARGHDWTMADLIDLAITWNVTTGWLATAIEAVATGSDPEAVVAEYGLDRRSYITEAGGQ